MRQLIYKFKLTECLIKNNNDFINYEWIIFFRCCLQYDFINYEWIIFFRCCLQYDFPENSSVLFLVHGCLSFVIAEQGGRVSVDLDLDLDLDLELDLDSPSDLVSSTVTVSNH